MLVWAKDVAHHTVGERVIFYGETAVDNRHEHSLNKYAPGHTLSVAMVFVKSFLWPISQEKLYNTDVCPFSGYLQGEVSQAESSSLLRVKSTPPEETGVHLRLSVSINVG